MTSRRTLLAGMIRIACILEARARKPGNVHPGVEFPDLCYEDFVQAAQAVAEVLPQAGELGVGPAVLEAVRRTQELVDRPTNPNLGIILLLAPLAAVPVGIPLQDGIQTVLKKLTIDDAQCVYQAIALANPGGMGRVDEADVRDVPTISLLDAMRLAADRDSIAAEYVTGFEIVLQTGVPFLADWYAMDRRPTSGETGYADWETSIIHLQLVLMSQFPDTLIARKCGRVLVEESAIRARHVLDAGGLLTEPGRQLLSQFDTWLRADGHRRNPGTTADLIAASLFAAMRDELIPFSKLESILSE